MSEILELNKVVELFTSQTAFRLAAGAGNDPPETQVVMGFIDKSNGKIHEVRAASGIFRSLVVGMYRRQRVIQICSEPAQIIPFRGRR